MNSYNKKQPPMANYIKKLLLLELVKCAQNQDRYGLKWIEDTMYHMALRWINIRRDRG